MKNKSIAVILLLSFVFISGIFAQTYVIEDPNKNAANFINKSLENNFLTAQSFDNNIDRRQNNSVFINQIGDENTVYIKTKASTSDIDILQQGNYNDVYLKIQANTITESVFQKGNYNSLVDFSTSSNNHNLELIQNGNNQNLIWYGGNSISEELKINMNGENQFIIVRNFN